MSAGKLKLENQGCFRFYTLARLITQGYQPMFAKLGITYTQYTVLLVLWEEDDLPVTEITRRLYLDTNTVTPLIKRMETAKLVKRRKSKTDARQTIVSLTERGRAMKQDAAQIPDCMMQSLTSKGVNAEDVASIFPLLDEMIEKLSKK